MGHDEDFEFESATSADDDSWMEAGGSSVARNSPNRGVIMTKGALERFVGLAPATMSKLIREGAPVVTKATRTRPWEINSASFIDWLVNRAVAEVSGDEESLSYDAAKRQDKQAQARLRELQIAEREGKLLPVANVTGFISSQFGIIRSRIMTIPSQVSGLAPDQVDQLTDAVHDVLTDLSGDKPEDWMEGGTDDDTTEENDSEEFEGDGAGG